MVENYRQRRLARDREAANIAAAAQQNQVNPPPVEEEKKEEEKKEGQDNVRPPDDFIYEVMISDDEGDVDHEDLE